MKFHGQRPEAKEYVHEQIGLNNSKGHNNSFHGHQSPRNRNVLFFQNQRFELIKKDHLSSLTEPPLIMTHANIAALLPPNLKHLDYNVFHPISI